MVAVKWNPQHSLPSNGWRSFENPTHRNSRSELLFPPKGGIFSARCEFPIPCSDLKYIHYASLRSILQALRCREFASRSNGAMLWKPCFYTPYGSSVLVPPCPILLIYINIYTNIYIYIYDAATETGPTSPGKVQLTLGINVEPRVEDIIA